MDPAGPDQGRPEQGLLLRPVGRLDADTCGELRHQLGTAFAAGARNVGVDLRDVTAVDQTGLGVLGGAARHLRKRGGALVVSNAGPGVATSMRINGLGDLLLVASSPELRVVAGAGKATGRTLPRALSVVPGQGLKQPS